MNFTQYRQCSRKIRKNRKTHPLLWALAIQFFLFRFTVPENAKTSNTVLEIPYASLDHIDFITVSETELPAASKSGHPLCICAHISGKGGFQGGYKPARYDLMSWNGLLIAGVGSEVNNMKFRPRNIGKEDDTKRLKFYLIVLLVTFRNHLPQNRVL